MNSLNRMSTVAIPIIIGIIVLYGLIEKKETYDIFVEGAKEGIEIVVRLFPTLLGIFVAIGTLRGSGVLDFIVNFISPITNFLKIPSEIMPLALIRPISGSASTAIATDIMKTYGVDSNIGLIASTIMGSTETTLYTIAIYTSAVGIKKIRFVLISALVGDVVRNACVCCFLAIFVVKFFLTFYDLNDIMFTEN
ncbi:MAG: spore maturation protein [Clostridia bacterium]|nr:spore maturation protein [Clostridia bacterium]